MSRNTDALPTLEGLRTISPLAVPMTPEEIADLIDRVRTLDAKSGRLKYRMACLAGWRTRRGLTR